MASLCRNGLCNGCTSHKHDTENFLKSTQILLSCHTLKVTFHCHSSKRIYARIIKKNVIHFDFCQKYQFHNVQMNDQFSFLNKLPSSLCIALIVLTICLTIRATQVRAVMCDTNMKRQDGLLLALDPDGGVMDVKLCPPSQDHCRCGVSSSQMSVLRAYVKDSYILYLNTHISITSYGIIIIKACDCWFTLFIHKFGKVDE